MISTQTESEIEDELPPLPKDRLEWEYHCRPMIKGIPNRLKYLPMILAIVLDNFAFKMEVLARQWGKTTMFGSDLAYWATTNYDFDQTYFNFKLDNLRTFSENKFRQDVFGTYPLSKYIKAPTGQLGAMNRVVTKTRSIIDMLLPGPEWQNSQGKSNRKMKVDEAQDHDWTDFQNARETQADTMGEVEIAGIGGYADTDHHNIWKSTNQMHWFYKKGEPYKGYENMSWRKDLEFDSDGLVYGDYMLDALDGNYVAQAPENKSRHGYWLPQTLNPRIPLTMEDAISKYKVSPEFSIEWKRYHDPNFNMSSFRRNVMAEFVEGELKPITTTMMMSLFDKNVSLTRSEDVDYDLGPVFVGIDWGGGGKTIVWIWQCINEKAPIFQLLWVERIDTADTDEQYDLCKNLIDAYEPDFVCIDAGGAPDRVQRIQKRYGDLTRRISYHPRPEKPLSDFKEELKQSLEMRYVIDRTFSLDRVIDLIRHPYVNDNDTLSTRIILPGQDYDDMKWVVKQFVSIEGEKAKLKSTGQTYIRYIHADNNPDDALQACNYALIAWHLWRSNSAGHVGGGLDLARNSNNYSSEDMV